MRVSAAEFEGLEGRVLKRSPPAKAAVVAAPQPVDAQSLTNAVAQAERMTALVDRLSEMGADQFKKVEALASALQKAPPEPPKARRLKVNRDSKGFIDSIDIT